MKISTLIKAGALVQLSRIGIARARLSLRHQQRRNRALGVLALAAAGAAAWVVLRRQRGEQAPAWPSRKKVRRDARRAEAARRARQPVSAAPPAVHVQREAPEELRAPLGDVVK